MERLQQADLNVPANRIELRELEGKHHTLFMMVRNDARGLIDHMFVDEADILVIASADKSDPIPVDYRFSGSHATHESPTGNRCIGIVCSGHF